MNTRTLAILGGAAIVVLVAGLVIGTGGGEQHNDAPQGQLAFPNLASKLQEAAKLEVVHHGATVHLVRKDAIWDVADRAGYPADQPKVHTLTTALTELRLAEPRTSNPDDYARLGVEDAQGKDANSTLVRVLDANGGAIAELILGHVRTGAHGAGDGVYVRRAGEAQAWLADGKLAASGDVMEWLDRDVANIDPPYVESVVVSRDKQGFTVARKDGKMTMTAPAEHPKLDQFKLDDMTHGLAQLVLDNVQPAPAPGARLGQAVVTSNKGVAVTVNVNKAGADAIWVEVSAAGEGDAKAQADAINAKTKGWAYQVPSWKEQMFVPTMDDLKAYQPPPPATPAPAAAPPQAAPAAKP